jgi:PAS domain S-box-containing protein
MSSRDDSASSSVADFLSGGGKMGALIRAHDWAATPLGAPDTWSQTLRTAVSLMLGAAQPVYIAWGSDLTSLYNDGYLPIVGTKHPGIGLPFFELWAEIADQFRPIVDATLAFDAQHLIDLPIALAGRPAVPIGYFTFSYTPLRDETGRAVGLYVAATETTDRVLAERRAAEERERQRQMLRQMPGFIGMLSGPDLIYTYVNDAYVTISERADFVGRRFRDVFADIEGQGFFEAFENAFHSGESVVTRGMELRLHGRDETQYVDFVLEPIRDDTGTVTGLFVGGYETTEVYRGNAALRASEARLAFLDRLGAETAPLADADAVLATTTRLVGEHLNVSVCAYADMDEDEDGFTIRGDWAAAGSTSIVGHYSLADFGKLAVENLSAGLPLVVNDNLRELAPEEAATFQNIGIAATICMPLVKEGRLTALMAIHDRSPRVWVDEELSLLLEVTARSWAHVERVAAVAGLRDSEERLSLAVENAEVGFWDVDVVNDTLIWPPRTKAMFGISADVPVTMQDFYDGLFPEDREATSEAYAAAADPARRSLYDVEYRTVGKEDGVIRWVAAKGRGVFDESGRCLRVAGTAIDISARKAAEAALQESEARLRDLNATLERRVAEALAERHVLADVIDGTDIFVQVADRDYNWLAINESAAAEFARIFGVPRPRAGDNMLEVLRHRPDDRAAVEAVWSRALGGEEFVEVDEFGDPSLDRRYYEMRFRVLRDADGRAAGAYQFVSDVTERLREQNRLREAEEALRQSQKMEAMGQLTGGVAHDFNNLLTPIIGSLDMLVRRGVGSERERRLIDGALQSAERAKTLVQRLLAFARRQPLQPVAVEIPKLVEGMVGLIGSTLGPTIDVRVDLAPDMPPAKADPNQLEMALLNLAVNARDAMPGGGELTIKVKRDSLHRGDPSGLMPGDYVLLCVIDTGTGMDEETRQRAIEPFFSTKGVGKGTGLGLSMVHGLAAQLGGGLTIESAPGKGTSIELWLPISTSPIGGEEAAISASTARVGRGVALLVDDEELVRMSTADMLIDLGFDVIEASSAEDALRLVKSRIAPDLLVTDHLMPGMTGVELARELHEIVPKLPILLVSGYAEVEGIAPELARLTKPFRNAELAASISALLPDGRG